jgi:hypothetical protein
MNKEFKINVWGIDVIVDFCFESWKVDSYRLVNDAEWYQIEEPEDFDLALVRKAEREAQDYIDYIKESYGEDRGYDNYLDQQVANEG